MLFREKIPQFRSYLLATQEHQNVLSAAWGSSRLVQYLRFIKEAQDLAD